MRPDRQPHAAVIGAKTLVIIHDRKWGWLLQGSGIRDRGSGGSWFIVRGLWIIAPIAVFLIPDPGSRIPAVFLIPNPGSRIPIEFARRANGFFHLPERAPALVGERIERADVGQRRQLVAAQPRALHDLLD